MTAKPVGQTVAGQAVYRPGRDFALAPLDSLSLYVHIPFCASRCRYCNFYLETGWSKAIVKRTLQAILNQSIQLMGQVFGRGPARIRTIYFGGGTPSVIDPNDLDQFLAAFRRIWQAAPGEWCVEANPESLSLAFLKVLAKHGINRLSLGVQTRNRQALAILGRRAKPADIDRALAIVGQARRDGTWRGQLNCDLITGLPELSLDDVAADCRYLTDQQADHVSVYSLTVEADTPLAQLKTWQPAGPEVHEAQWQTAQTVLEAAGFVNYEVSNFAKPGAQSQHNNLYWQLQPYAGLGPGAVGTLPGRLLPDGPVQPLRLTGPNLFDFGRANPGYRLEAINRRDFFVDHLLTGLRTPAGWSLDYLQAVFGPGIQRAVDCLAQNFARRQVLDSQPGRLAPNQAGRLILDPLLTDGLLLLDRFDQNYWQSLDCRWPIAQGPSGKACPWP